MTELRHSGRKRHRVAKLVCYDRGPVRCCPASSPEDEDLPSSPGCVKVGGKLRGVGEALPCYRIREDEGQPSSSAPQVALGRRNGSRSGSNPAAGIPDGSVFSANQFEYEAGLRRSVAENVHTRGLRACLYGCF